MSGILARSKTDPVRSYNKKKLGRNSGKSAVCDRTNLDSTISGIHKTDDFLSAILKRSYSF